MFDSLKFFVNESIDLDDILKSLDKCGYSRCRKVSIEGDYSLTGETLIVYPVTFEYPVRISFIRSSTIRRRRSRPSLSPEMNR